MRGPGVFTTSRWHLGNALLLAALAALLVAAAATRASADWGDDGGVTSGNKVTNWVFEQYEAAGRVPGSKKNDDDGLTYEWDLGYVCVDSQYRHEAMGGCPNGGLPRIEYCDDGTEAIPPLWYRYETPPDSGLWSSWFIFRWYYCGPEHALEYHVRMAWAEMPIAPHIIELQPNTGWVFSNVPTIAMVDRNPRELHTTLLGRAVVIRANPGAMTWTWGDGNTTITYDLGSPYPNPSLTHTYAYFEGDVVITLTSTWSGEYSLDGGATWRPAPGTARTESIPVPLTVYNPHTHVVACGTTGTCQR